MEIQIENLKAKMRGIELNSYQKGLALDEFKKLIAHTEALEQQLRQYNVSGQSKQLSCDTCVFNTHSWSGDYPCANCCNFDKHKAT